MLVMLLTACGKKNEVEKIRDLELTVVTQEEIPEELKNTLEEKREGYFKITYADNGYLYICTGYGKQVSGGYSITVEDLYETNNAIYFKTELLGPKPEENKKEVESFPYIVVKTEYLDKTVVFDS